MMQVFDEELKVFGVLDVHRIIRINTKLLYLLIKPFSIRLRKKVMRHLQIFQTKTDLFLLLNRFVENYLIDQ